MKNAQPIVIRDWPNESFRAGKFVYATDDNMVIVTKDTASGIISVGSYTYKDYETASENAWRMACRQMRAA